MNKKDESKCTLSPVERILLGYNRNECSNNVENSREFIQNLNQEIIFDSLLLETSKNFPKIHGLENDEKWFEFINDILQNEQDKTLLYSDQLWKEIVSETTQIRYKTLKKRNNFLINSWYLIAAVVLLSAIPVGVFLKKIGNKKWEKTITYVQNTTDTLNQMSNISGLDQNKKNENRSTNVIALDSGSTVSIDPGAEVADVQMEKNKVVVTVVKGAVSFSVAKKKERSFIVRAGLADIVVTGTKFRVARTEDLLTVAVHDGTVNTIYNRGTEIRSLSSGQIALLFGDTITIITSDSIPDFQGRHLLKNLIPSDESELNVLPQTTKLEADSLINNLFTAGLHYNTKEALVFDICRILDSKGRYKDAVTVLKQLNGLNNGLINNINVSNLMCRLLLKTGDTSNTLKYLKNQIETTNDSKEACKMKFQLFKINSNSRRLLDADSSLLNYVKCENDESGLDNLIINHAHQLRNASLFDMALYWYEYVFVNLKGSAYHNDAEYWISFCVIQNGIVKRSHVKDSTRLSKW
jgi:hypothetical protein